MIKLAVNTLDLRKLIGKLERAKNGLKNPALIQDRVLKVVAKANEANILTQGRRIGASYPRLSPAQIARKRKKGQPIKALLGNGNLLRSVKEESRLKVSNQKTSKGYKIRVFTDNPIAKFVESGRRPRRIFGLNSEDLRRITVSIEQRFLREIA
jgi:hypothetical protein